MRFSVRSLFVFILLLIPSAQFAWRNRDSPLLGYLHDDGLFFVSAKSIASGNGYKIPSLPENPAQTKFPPLFPLYLSITWMLSPAFPANLATATLLCWLTLAALLALAWRLYRGIGISEKRIWLLCALLALNPYLILFGSSMFSEIFFTCCVLAALLFASRPGRNAILAAGIAAGCAYLSRTAGVALLVSIPLVLLWNKENRRALIFVVTMFPFVLGWTLWTSMHAIHSTDPTLIYYTNYVRYQFLNVGWDNIAIVLWKNLDQILYGLGALVLPKVLDGGAAKILTQVIAVAMISGLVRMLRQPAGDDGKSGSALVLQYACFALISTGILLLWHFPPNERFMIPVFPLMLAGLLAELEHLLQMLKGAFRHKDANQRVVAGGLSAVLAGIFFGAFAIQMYMTFAALDALAAEKRAKLMDLKAAYSWISANLPPDAKILSYDDPLLYLYTGRPGNYLVLMPRWWYSQDHTSIVNAYRNVAAYCRSRGLEYIYFTSDDLSRETDDDDRQAIQKSIAANPELAELYHSGIGTVYRVRAVTP